MMEEKIKILICDDHALFRSGLISLLQTEDKFEIIGEAENGRDLIEKYFFLNPDIVIADISMPELSGLEAFRELKKQNEFPKVLFVSMLYDENYVYHIYKEGGSGLLSKNIVKDELFHAIDMIYKDQKYFGLNYDNQKLNELLYKNQASETFASNVVDEMTEREKEILYLIGEGLTSSQIADKLFISKRTIDTHRQHIMQKNGIKNLPSLIKFAVNYLNKTI